MRKCFGREMNVCRIASGQTDSLSTIVHFIVVTYMAYEMIRCYNSINITRQPKARLSNLRLTNVRANTIRPVLVMPWRG